jgi:hypothetical protein
MWPLHLIRNAWRERAHVARMKRIDPKASKKLLARVRAGEAKAAHLSTLGWTTMASGSEEEVCIELRFEGEGAPDVTPWTKELDELLAARGVPRTSVETYRLGLTLIFGWGLWMAVVFAITSAVTGTWVGLLFAGITLLALLAFARS